MACLVVGVNVPSLRITGGSEKSKNAEVCLICDVIIMTGMIPMMLFTVEGDYQGWLHRKCVSMPKKLYIAIGESSDPYFCPYCKFNVYQQEITSQV